MGAEGHKADFNMSLGSGLSKLQGKVFRTGHLGDFNDLTLVGTLSGFEMGFLVAGVLTERAVPRLRSMTWRKPNV